MVPEKSQSAITPIKVLFHSINGNQHCDDGFGAAWAVYKFYKNIGCLDSVEFIPVRYGQNPPMNKIANNNVLIVDFSYKRAQTIAIKAEAKSLVVLDHHKGAEEELKGIEDCIFDMNRSGAVMAWQYLMPNLPVPPILQIVQDNDLWRHKLPYALEMTRWIRSAPQIFSIWDELNSRLLLNSAQCITEAKAMQKLYDQMLIGQLESAIDIEFEGHKTKIVNCSKAFASDICHSMMEQFNLEIALAYIIHGPEHVEISIRSKGNINVKDIAKAYGGGGHEKASGWIAHVNDLQFFYFARTC